MKLPHLQFSTKLISLVIFSCLFPTLLMGMQSYTNAKDYLNTSTLNYLDSVARISASQVTSWQEELTSTAEAIARSNYVVQYLNQINHLSSINHESSDEYFLALFRLNSVMLLCNESSRWFTEVCLISNDGHLILTDNGNEFTQQLKPYETKMALATLQQRGSIFTSIYPAARPAQAHMNSTELSLGFPTMWLMSTVRGEAMAPGVLACRIAVSDLDQLFRLDQNKIPLDIFVVRNDGWLVSSSRPINRSGFRQLVPCGSSFKYPGNSLEGYQAFDGSTVIGAWQPIKNTDLSILVQCKRDIISEPRQEARNSILVTSFGLSLIMATLGFLVSERLLSPLRRLTLAARELAGGQRQVRVHLKRGDEIGELGDTFDHMAASLDATLSDLEVARDKALAASQAKSRFLANMTHELRTPLNAIIGYSEMLIAEVRDEGKEQWAEDLTVVRRSGKDLLTLINSILDLSKIEANKMTIHAEPFILQELLQDVSQVVLPLTQENNNKYICHYDGEAQLTQDRGKLKQILLNLISNSAKFTKDGCITTEVQLSDNIITIQVADNGIGMTEEQCHKVFDEFAQADESTTRKYGGTGLGLAIVKHFVELMGGQINLSSHPGQGTIFTLTLPTTYSST